MTNRGSLVALAASLSAFSACAPSVYRRNYRRVPSAPDALAPCLGDPIISSPDDPQAAGQDLEKQGYVSIGYATFDSPTSEPAQDPDLLAQARSVGACRVILSSHRSGSRDVGFGVETRTMRTYDVSVLFFAKPK